ncbi:hypothetical protein [Corallococcus macrosporus]|uniref:Uncharacterized protein n=2 Tax=Myxococcaceae TaxID=31 RepID=A0A250JMY1_9BACT|nr:hypothetical protein [Corallococcus macrosporus]AEI62887.1 hypothetical protein LILAB_04830 [Corallococcus macrosporus]ATB45224.1 hypothetical protein MYMAC_000809 [Corallococcus macrosporus DSM 14697]
MACGLALATLGGAGIQVLGTSCLDRLRRRKRGHHRWWHRSQEPLMESMETALTMALLGVSVLPLVADAASPEWSARPDALPETRDERPAVDAGDDLDDLDFEAAFASY